MSSRISCGSLITIPPRTYVNFYPDVNMGNSTRVTSETTMLVLQDSIPRRENWCKVLLSDQRIGYVCSIGLSVQR